MVTGVVLVVLLFLWLKYKKTIFSKRAKSPINPTKVSSAMYPVFPGTTAEESDTDDTLDELADIEEEL